MESWRKGREFLGMLAGKQRVLQVDILKSNRNLVQIKSQIELQYQQIDKINQSIRMLTPEGVVSRSALYSGIRQQGALLMEQQLVFHKLSELETEKQAQAQFIEQQQSLLNQLDKKQHKITNYLQRLRRDYIRRSDNAAENEIQEIMGYGRKSAGS